jgi:hypothetical protein
MKVQHLHRYPQLGGTFVPQLLAKLPLMSLKSSQFLLGLLHEPLARCFGSQRMNCHVRVLQKTTYPKSTVEPGQGSTLATDLGPDWTVTDRTEGDVMTDETRQSPTKAASLIATDRGQLSDYQRPHDRAPLEVEREA